MGQAAHPLPAGEKQSLAMSVEDGAVLGRLFSHLQYEDQIEPFLEAFEDLRFPRCSMVHQMEIDKLMFMTMPPGEERKERDKTMRLKRDAGQDVLTESDILHLEGAHIWMDAREAWSWDATDEADNWYVNWGLLRERCLQRGNISLEHIPVREVLVAYS